jgi:hypothetical protein
MKPTKLRHASEMKLTKEMLASKPLVQTPLPEGCFLSFKVGLESKFIYIQHIKFN